MIQTVELILQYTRADTITGVGLRGLIWLIAVLILAAGIDNNHEQGKIKSQVGWFFIFIVSTGIMSLLAFGFVPTF